MSAADVCVPAAALGLLVGVWGVVCYLVGLWLGRAGGRSGALVELRGGRRLS